VGEARESKTLPSRRRRVAPEISSKSDPWRLFPLLKGAVGPFTIERIVGLLTISAPLGLALNLLWQTHFRVPVAIVIATARPLSSYVQEIVMWFVIGLGTVVSVAMATIGSRMIRRGRVIAAIALWLGGAFFLIPYTAQFFNDGTFFAPVIPVLYVIYCAVGFVPEVPSAWILPGTALFLVLAFIVLSPLPASAVTWNGKTYATIIVSERNNETLVFDQDSVSFSTYPTDQLKEVRPCFRTLNDGRIPWVESTQPNPQCPTELLPVRG
jgi:hypothetical protein